MQKVECCLLLLLLVSSIPLRSPPLQERKIALWADCICKTHGISTLCFYKRPDKIPVFEHQFKRPSAEVANTLSACGSGSKRCGNSALHSKTGHREDTTFIYKFRNVRSRAKIKQCWPQFASQEFAANDEASV